MDFYNAEKYALMCNTPLVQQHWDTPEWGDYIYTEEYGRKVLGFDWLRIGALAYNNKIVKFAMLPDITKFSAKTYPEGSIPDFLEIKSGEYVVMTIKNPIWQPKVEQILKMFKTHKHGTGGVLRNFTDDAFGSKPDMYYRQFDYLEQQLLAYFMKIINALFWLESRCGWFTIEQCKRLS